MGPASVGAKGEPGTAVWGRRATGGQKLWPFGGGFGSGRGPSWPRGHCPLGCPWQCGLPSRAQSVAWMHLAEAFTGVGSGASKPVLGLGLVLSPRVSLLGPPEGFALGGE